MKSVTTKPEPVLCYPPLHLQTPLLHRTVDRPRSTPPPINPPQVHAVTWPSPLALVKLHCHNLGRCISSWQCRTCKSGEVLVSYLSSTIFVETLSPWAEQLSATFIQSFPALYLAMRAAIRITHQSCYPAATSFVKPPWNASPEA